MVSIDVTIDHRVHNRIIGQKGKNVRKIMDEFKVDIRFPRDQTDDTITITGSEDAVEDCEEYLLVLEEEYVRFLIIILPFYYCLFYRATWYISILLLLTVMSPFTGQTVLSIQSICMDRFN